MTGRNDIPGNVEIGDINGDGRNDLVIMGDASQTITVYLQSVTGTFACMCEFAVGDTQTSYPDRLALGDINGDGALDIAAVSTSITPGLMLLRSK